MLLIAIVIAAFRGVAGSNHDPAFAPALEPGRTVSLDPSGGYDGVTEKDPDSANANVTPSVASSTVAEVQAVATRFTTAWLNHSAASANAWRAGMSPHATKALMDKLASTDPSRVPANNITGDLALVVRNSALIEAAVPLDAGRLRLRLLTVGGRWKVDSIDWERPT